jgi:peptide/nickel transport system substrate-binding protein
MRTANRSVRALIAVALLAILAAACAPATPARPNGGGAPGQADAPTGQRQAGRTLVTVVRLEPTSLAVRPVSESGSGVGFVTRLFNATLDLVDARDQPHPYQAEDLPQLNTDAWKVSPDGRMETTYRLRQNLTWQDGHPLTADDFVFALEVYKTPELGVRSSPPIAQMDEILAPDARTLVVRWNALFPNAGVMSRIGGSGSGGFQALPRHILEQSYREDPAETFANNPYWSTQYIGAGPFKLERWDQGTAVEGSAFDGHVLGRPKIDRIQVRFIADENTVLANILSENVHMATDRSIRFEHAQVMRREWAQNDRGTVLLTMSLLRYVLMQFRPEVVAPRSMLDVRVRRAIAQAVDKQALNEGVFDDQTTTSDTFLHPDVPYFQDIQRVITRYPYDPRESERLMAEAGYTKGADSVFASGGERFAPVFWEESGSQNDKELGIFVAVWRQAGFDMQTFVLNAAQLRDGQLRTTYPAMYTTQGGAATEDRLDTFASTTIPRQTNRFQGNNRGAYTNPEYDRLWDSFTKTLDRQERNAQVVQMMRILSEDVPAIPIYFNMAPWAHLSILKGPEMGARVPDPNVAWNIHEWSWAQ